MTDTTSDYLAAEGALIDRLRACIPELADDNRVASEASIASVQSGRIAMPAALVLWSHDSPDASGYNVGPQRIEQTWLVCLVVKVANDKTGARARSEAGPLITKAVLAVRGWTPDAEVFEPFVYTPTVQPQMVAGGTLYVPLPFKTAFVL